MPPKSSAPRRTSSERTLEIKAKNDIKRLGRHMLNGDCSLSASDLATFISAIAVLAPAPGTFALPESLFQKLDEDGTLALLNLLSQSLRRSLSSAVPGVDDAERTAYRKLRKSLALLLLESICSVPHTPRHPLLGHLWLRTQVLRCYAALLADAGQLVHQRPSRRNVEAADALLEEVSDYMWQICEFLYFSADLEPKANQTEVGPGRGVLPVDSKPSFKFLAVQDIANSCLLDTWASCWLRLLGSGEWSSHRAVKLLSEFADAISMDVWGYRMLMPALQSCVGPLSYLMAAHVVGLASCCDGGTSYGLSSVMPHTPIWDINKQPVQCGSDVQAHARRGGSIFLSLSLARVTLDVWQLNALNSNLMGPASSGVPAAPRGSSGLDSFAAGAALLPPLNDRATLDICIRLLNATAGGASARINTPPTAATSAAHRPSSIGMHLDPLLVSHVASAALQIVLMKLSRLLRSCRDAAATAPVVGPAGPRPSDMKQLAGMWGAYVRVLNTAMNSKARQSRRSMSSELGTPWEEFGKLWVNFEVFMIMQLVPGAEPGCIPGGLGPDAAAMVAAGAIPMMERLVRYRHPEAAPLCTGEAVWTELLMYGPMNELAALIASLGKRIAAAIVRAEPIRSAAGMSVCWHVDKRDGAMGVGPAGSGLLEAIITCTRFLDVLTQRQALLQLAPVLRASAPPPADADAGGDGGDAAAARAGGRQLLTLSCFAIMKLLPQLAEALCLFTCTCVDEVSCSLCERSLCDGVGVVLRCCTLPLGAEADADAKVAVGTASGRAAEAAVAQWRNFLLHDVGLDRLLRTIVELLQMLSEADSVRTASCLEATCEWAFRVFPEKMRAAGLGSLHPTNRASQPCAVGGEDIGAARAEKDAALAAALPSLDEVRRCMAPYCCASALCVELATASELLLPQLRCGGGCGGRMGWYCSEKCQVAHWKAGHKAECLAAKEAAGTTAAAAASVADGAAAGGSQ